MKIRETALFCLFTICISALGSNSAQAEPVKPGALALFKVESLNTTYLVGGDVLVLALYSNNSNGIPGPFVGRALDRFEGGKWKAVGNINMCEGYVDYSLPTCDVNGLKRPAIPNKRFWPKGPARGAIIQFGFPPVPPRGRQSIDFRFMNIRSGHYRVRLFDNTKITVTGEFEVQPTSLFLPVPTPGNFRAFPDHVPLDSSTCLGVPAGSSGAVKLERFSDGTLESWLAEIPPGPPGSVAPGDPRWLFRIPLALQPGTYAATLVSSGLTTLFVVNPAYTTSFADCNGSVPGLTATPS